MLTLIIGGSGSGKSAIAENWIVSQHSEYQYYLATMDATDQESQTRVLRHREMRKGKGFHTIESPTHIEKTILPKRGSVLLECMSNLVANEMFMPQGRRDQIVSVILEGIKTLESQADHVVVVTNNVFEDGQVYPGDTEEYLQYLGEINGKLAKMATVVMESVQGKLLIYKGQREVYSMQDGLGSHQEDDQEWVLLTGGAYQGKLELAKGMAIKEGRSITEESIWDGKDGIPSSWENIEILKDFHEMVGKWIKNGHKEEDLISLMPNKTMIITTNELGCGLVPLDAESRRYREAAGRAAIVVAAKAKAVYRVSCGIAQRIDGNKMI